MWSACLCEVGRVSVWVKPGRRFTALVRSCSAFFQCPMTRYAVARCLGGRARDSYARVRVCLGERGCKGAYGSVWLHPHANHTKSPHTHTCIHRTHPPRHTDTHTHTPVALTHGTCTSPPRKHTPMRGASHEIPTRQGTHRNTHLKIVHIVLRLQRHRLRIAAQRAFIVFARKEFPPFVQELCSRLPPCGLRSRNHWT